MNKILDPKFFKHLLGIAGMINIMAGIVFAFFPHFFLYFFYRNLPDAVFASPAILSIVTLMFIFILIIGFGYVWSMKDPVRNKLYVLIGGMGKLAAVILWVYSYFLGYGTELLLLASFNDVGLGLIFVIFFLKNRKE